MAALAPSFADENTDVERMATTEGQEGKQRRKPTSQNGDGNLKHNSSRNRVLDEECVIVFGRKHNGFKVPQNDAPRDGKGIGEQEEEGGSLQSEPTDVKTMDMQTHTESR